MQKKLFPDSQDEKANGASNSDLVGKDQLSHQAWLAIKQELLANSERRDIPQLLNTARVECSHNLLTIILPDIASYQSFIDIVLPRLEATKKQLSYDFLSVRMDIERQPPPRSNALNEDEADDFQFDGMNNGARSQDGKAFAKSLSNQSNLNSNYLFENFVRGPSNQFSLATCLNVAENPGKNYNPLFIYGHTGLGKTHLLHAVGNKVLSRNPNAVVTYISSERFMNEMIYCLRHHKMWEFRQKYRHCDTLLVDDIQFISGKKSTQEEFFHTFNTLYEAKKQIVITSDMFPQEIPDIEERLRNRFQWGLIADIQPPDTEHRIAILYSKAEQLGISLTHDVADFIANKAKRNIRELEGALHRIAAFAALQGRPIDRQLAVETFQSILGEPTQQITIEIIQKTVADHFNLKVTDLKSKKRLRALTIPRQIAMYLSRQHTDGSFPEIGEKFGGKDHTTVMHAVKKIEGLAPKDLDIRAHLESLKRRLEQIC